VTRFSFGNSPRLYVLNDSGPAVVNLAEPSDVQARLDDWAYGQFFPSSCTDCTTDKQPAEILPCCFRTTAARGWGWSRVTATASSATSTSACRRPWSTGICCWTRTVR
jgi:hypothetical protein